MKAKNGGAALLLGAMSFAASMTVMAGSIESDPIDFQSDPIDFQPDYILKVCTEPVSTGSTRYVANSVSPAFGLKNYLQNRDKHYVDLAAIKITLLEGTKHGEIVSGIADYARSSYLYNPTEGYAGKDKATFMAEFEGKRYKIIVELHVFDVAPSENNSDTNSCPPPKLIKVNGKPVSGSSDYNLDNITITFTDLPSGALGQTTGSTITLDTAAAGNGWFIDTTPSDNSEYLPTSNPFEWVAKAGSAAAGKMDMLSVLLHEYGHALGIDHNPNAHDYMGTTLTTGVRRLPTADEMVLMQQLIAQAKTELTGSVGAALAANDDELFAAKAAPTTPSNVPFPTLPLGGMGIAFAEDCYNATAMMT